LLTEDEELIKHFRHAADELIKKKGGTRSQDAIFVRWINEPAVHQLEYFHEGCWILAAAIGIHFVLCTIVAFFAHFGTGTVPKKI